MIVRRRGERNDANNEVESVANEKHDQHVENRRVLIN